MRTDIACEPATQQVSSCPQSDQNFHRSPSRTRDCEDTYEVARRVPARRGASLGSRHGGLGKAQRRSLLRRLSRSSCRMGIGVGELLPPSWYKAVDQSSAFPAPIDRLRNMAVRWLSRALSASSESQGKLNDSGGRVWCRIVEWAGRDRIAEAWSE